MRYFFQKVCCSPSFDKAGYRPIENGQYLYTDGSLWMQRRLISLGWGREEGLCRLPIPDYETLLLLAFAPIKKAKRRISDDEYNVWGALSVLIDDYPLEFLKYIEKNLNNEEFLQKLLSRYELMNGMLYWNEKKIYQLLKEEDKKVALKWIELKKRLPQSE